MNLFLPPLCLRLWGKSGVFLFWGMEEGSKTFTWNWSLSCQILILSTEGLIIRSNFNTAGRNLCVWQSSQGSFWPATSWDGDLWPKKRTTPTLSLDRKSFLSAARNTSHHLFTMKPYFMLEQSCHSLIQACYLFWPLRAFSCLRLAVHSEGAGWKDGTAACTTRSRQLPPL